RSTEPRGRPLTRTVAPWLLRSGAAAAGIGRAVQRTLRARVPAAESRIIDTRVHRVPAVKRCGSRLSVANDRAERPVQDRKPASAERGTTRGAPRKRASGRCITAANLIV
ncbi:MAG: hypothetical protein ACJ8AO_06310, partial [Gemmatimonadaceae bacterium]